MEVGLVQGYRGLGSMAEEVFCVSRKLNRDGVGMEMERGKHWEFDDCF